MCMSCKYILENLNEKMNQILVQFTQISGLIIMGNWFMYDALVNS